MNWVGKMTWTAISKSEHSEMLVRRPDSLSFLNKDILVSICSFELAACATYLPIIFGKENNQIMPFAMMGIERNKNLIINSEGKWIIDFFPANIATYPFKLAEKENGEKIIVFFNDGKLVSPDGEGERLFNEDGTESKIFSHYIQLLARVEKSNGILQEACSLLEDLDVFEPFAVEVPSGGEDKARLDGLIRINPAKFKDLDDKDLVNLRQKNALDLAYAHFYSLGSIRRLNLFRNAGGQTTEELAGVSSKVFGSDKQSLNFENC